MTQAAVKAQKFTLPIKDQDCSGSNATSTANGSMRIPARPSMLPSGN